MFKLTLASLVGLAALGWLIADPVALFQAGPPPPTIRAEPGPVKQRPAGYAAGQQRPRPTVAHDGSAVPAVDVNLILAR